uniref:Zinc knuckle CX2CX4HX4C n=1 Tax=Tanacetum cinerariifolium TaxID=118510 RepID=A0A6L2MIW9_TANCI|nr:zinc knuckle CX2CX4HX4C [Tanacetum cinerariifolium]
MVEVEGVMVMEDGWRRLEVMTWLVLAGWVARDDGEMVDSGKASGSNSIGKYNIKSDNSDVHDHGNHDVAIPLMAIEEVSNRFANILYGYFIGKRLPFHIVKNYVKNAFAKYGIERVMLHNGFFFF